MKESGNPSARSLILMKKTLLTIFAAIAALASCQKNEITGQPEHSVLTAHMEQVDATRTMMDEDNNIRWSEGDQIIAFMKTSLGRRYQVQSSYVGETFAEFSDVSETSGTITAGTELSHNVAYYPYASAIACEKSGPDYVLNVTLPAEQTYTAGSFGNGSFPMAAVSETNDMTFLNVCGGMKLQFKGTQKLASVRVEGKNSEKISGAAVITAYTDGTKPSITMASDASTSVTLDCGEGVQLDENTATAFIITIPPVVFSKGFTVTVTDTEGYSQTIETDKSNEVKRSSLLVMPEVTVEIEKKVPDNQIWYTASEKVEPAGLETMYGSTMVIESHVYDEAAQRGVITFTTSLNFIPDNFFRRKNNVTDVKLPDCVIVIGSSAFYDCNLTRVTLPSGIREIWSSAFNTLQEIEFLGVASISEISESAINTATLRKITGPNASEDGRFLMRNGEVMLIAFDGLTELELPAAATKLSAPMTSSEIERITLPSSVTKVRSLFRMGALKEVNIAGDDVDLGKQSPFVECPALERFSGPMAAQEGRCLVSDTDLIHVAGSGLLELAIPEGIQNIYMYAVTDCESLKTITFPSTITNIGYLDSCHNLEEFTCMAVEPPFLPSYYLPASLERIYVPAESVIRYKAKWTNVADIIYSLTGVVDYNYDYIDEDGNNYGKGVEINGVVWAPVNCGYHPTDYKYGKLYQWGRKYGQGYGGKYYVDDIEEGEISDATVAEKVEGPIYFYNNYDPEEKADVFYSNTSSPFDWTSSPSSSLWNSGNESTPVKAHNDPCPTGWRVPTYNEFDCLLTDYESITKTTNEDGLAGYWINFPENPKLLFFTLGGSYTRGGYGNGRGKWAGYWSSNTYGDNARFLYINTDGIELSDTNRTCGYNVRCVKQFNE